MTPERIGLVKSSFAHILPISAQAGTMFYDRLFTIAPQLRPMFVNDMEEQGRKLMLTLATVVYDLDRLDRIIPAASELARRHVAYGACEEHYAVVGEALLWTLGTALGPRFTPETEAAWAEAYRILSDAMIAAARQVA